MKQAASIEMQSDQPKLRWTVADRRAANQTRYLYQQNETTPQIVNPNPSYLCEQCEDQKFVYRLPDYEEVPYRHCTDYLADCGLSDEQKHKTIDGLWDRQDDTDGCMRTMRFLAKKILERKTGMLVFQGPNGVGKTHILAAIVVQFCTPKAEYCPDTVEAKYYRAGEIIRGLFEKTISIERLKRVYVLIIDELDKLSDGHFGMLRELLIIATNMVTNSARF